MRSVDKGTAPRTYTAYQQAKPDLTQRLGWYCSYCEMCIDNEPHLEHVQPKAKNPALNLVWDNFLLACFHCNNVKDDKNKSLSGYLWPDVDNTSCAFDFDPTQNEIVALSIPAKKAAEATIDLLGLNRGPASSTSPTAADFRWLHRQKAWDIAQKSLRNWHKNPSPDMADQIALTSLGGHYSIWLKVFSDVPEVLEAIKKEYTAFNTYTPIIDPNTGSLVLRPGGTF